MRVPLAVLLTLTADSNGNNYVSRTILVDSSSSTVTISVAIFGKPDIDEIDETSSTTGASDRVRHRSCSRWRRQQWQPA